jgi:hypothetical protein
MGMEGLVSLGGGRKDRKAVSKLTLIYVNKISEMLRYYEPGTIGCFLDRYIVTKATQNSASDEDQAEC